MQVGIAPAASVNQAPYAVRDTVTIRPGTRVAVPVLANDSVPDGDEFGFAPDDPVTFAAERPRPEGARQREVSAHHGSERADEHVEVAVRDHRL